jgi:hypothetical protein
LMLSNDTWNGNRPINDGYLRHATPQDLKKYSTEFAALETRFRESTQHVARYEPESGTVSLEEKQTGTEHRSIVEMHGASAQETIRTKSAKSDELEAARAITANALGESARTVDAVVDGGTYRGVIIGETERHLLQRQSAGLAVLHPKELLDRQLQVGEVFAINYSNGRGWVREAHDRGKAQELGR